MRRRSAATATCSCSTWAQPVRVLDLAYDLVRLAGRDPDSQPIETVGLRPGEKLHEELFYDWRVCGADREREGPARPCDRPAARRSGRTPAGCSTMATGADEPALHDVLLDYVRGLEASDAQAPHEST